MTDIIVVKVKPGSRKGPLVEIGSTGELTIYVREPAVDGKANDAVARLLAAHLQLPRSRIELVSGAMCCSCRARSAFVLAADRSRCIAVGVPAPTD